MSRPAAPIASGSSAVAQITARPLALSYDDLPPGSDIRRQYRADGTVLITVPGAQVPPAARRAAIRAALVSGSILSPAFLTIAFVVFITFVRNNRVSGGPLLWATAFFALFCTAIVALVAWVRFRMHLEAMETGRRQSTVMAVSAQRLIAETSGPFGSAGYDLPRTRIAQIEVHRTRLFDQRGQRWRVSHLELVLTNGRCLALLPGRDETELRWIAGSIRQRLALAGEP